MTRFFSSSSHHAPIQPGNGASDRRFPSEPGRTASSPARAGGPIGVLVGDIGENISTAFIGGHLWGQTSGYSTTMLQPMIFYNLPNAWNIHYNNMITYDWKASSSDAWTVPVGLAVGKMFALENGHGLEPFIGVHNNVERPKGAADWTIK